MPVIVFQNYKPYIFTEILFIAIMKNGNDVNLLLIQ